MGSRDKEFSCAEPGLTFSEVNNISHCRRWRPQVAHVEEQKQVCSERATGNVGARYARVEQERAARAHEVAGVQVSARTHRVTFGLHKGMSLEQNTPLARLLVANGSHERFSELGAGLREVNLLDYLQQKAEVEWWNRGCKRRRTSLMLLLLGSRCTRKWCNQCDRNRTEHVKRRQQERRKSGTPQSDCAPRKQAYSPQRTFLATLDTLFACGVRERYLVGSFGWLEVWD